MAAQNQRHKDQDENCQAQLCGLQIPGGQSEKGSAQTVSSSMSSLPHQKGWKFCPLAITSGLIPISILCTLNCHSLCLPLVHELFKSKDYVVSD